MYPKIRDINILLSFFSKQPTYLKKKKSKNVCMWLLTVWLFYSPTYSGQLLRLQHHCSFKNTCLCVQTIDTRCWSSSCLFVIHREKGEKSSRWWIGCPWIQQFLMIDSEVCNIVVASQQTGTCLFFCVFPYVFQVLRFHQPSEACTLP